MNDPIITYDPPCGCDITTAVRHLISIAPATGGEAVMTFNGIEVRARSDSSLSTLVYSWRAEGDRRAEAYRASPEYASAVAEQRRKEEKRRADLAAELATAPATMTIRDRQAWEAFVANNRGMGAGVLAYAERWARLMEGRLTRGESIFRSHRETSHLADDEGMSNTTHAFAVGVLRLCWAHGEELYAVERGRR